MASHTNTMPSPLLEKGLSDSLRPMQPLTERTNRDYFFQLSIEMDCKELPAPPPPSPVHRTAHICQPIDEVLVLPKSDTLDRAGWSVSTLETSMNKNIAFAQQSPSRNSPLRQVSSQMDVDTYSKRTPSPGRNRLRDCSLLLGSYSKRGVTLPDSPGRDRSSSASSFSSRPTSPAFNMAYLRSTIHGIPTTPRGGIPSKSRLPSEACSRPPLSGRQISSPLISDQCNSPTLFDFRRPVTPSKTPQSRSEFASTQCSDPLHKGELISYFSDSEDGDKQSKRSSSSKKCSLGKRESRGRSRRFRRRLSGTFAFLSCGTE